MDVVYFTRDCFMRSRAPAYEFAETVEMSPKLI